MGQTFWVCWVVWVSRWFSLHRYPRHRGHPKLTSKNHRTTESIQTTKNSRPKWPGVDDGWTVCVKRVFGFWGRSGFPMVFLCRYPTHRGHPKLTSENRRKTQKPQTPKASDPNNLLRMAAGPSASTILVCLCFWFSDGFAMPLPKPQRAPEADQQTLAETTQNSKQP